MDANASIFAYWHTLFKVVVSGIILCERVAELVICAAILNRTWCCIHKCKVNSIHCVCVCVVTPIHFLLCNCHGFQ